MGDSAPSQISPFETVVGKAFARSGVRTDVYTRFGASPPPRGVDFVANANSLDLLYFLPSLVIQPLD
jgi:hypothetical protein